MVTTVTVKFALAQPAALLPLETAAIDGILTPRQNFKLHPSLKYEQPCIYSLYVCYRKFLWKPKSGSLTLGQNFKLHLSWKFDQPRVYSKL